MSYNFCQHSKSSLAQDQELSYRPSSFQVAGLAKQQIFRQVITSDFEQVVLVWGQLISNVAGSVDLC